MKIFFIFSCSGMFPVPGFIDAPENVMFHLLSNRIFRDLFLNGKQPRTLDSI